MFSKPLKYITGCLTISTAAATATGLGLKCRNTTKDAADDKPHVVVIGGGIIGSWSTWLLCHLAR